MVKPFKHLTFPRYGQTTNDLRLTMVAWIRWALSPPIAL